MRSGLFLLGFLAMPMLACGRKTNADPPPTRELADSGVSTTSPQNDGGGTPASELDAGAAMSKPDPFGIARTTTRTVCSAIGTDHVAERDMKTSFVDGDDLLAIVNRSPTGQLAPDWAPSDLVDIQTGKSSTASDCEKFHCLRRDAATALGELLQQMKKEGFPGKVESAFRSYGFQCGTFNNWAKKSSFCEATEQSALPGHSQHQLGTTVDLFSEEWAKDDRGVFREGFGCTDAGRYLREHATEFGFVMPYPIHPDDRHPKQKCVARWDIPVNINPRTGYRYEHWHLRFIGKDGAARFRSEQVASGLGSPNELTLEQWLRKEKGIIGSDAELPVCDGCNCGACSTLADRGANVCDRKGGALHLDGHGRPVAVEESPSIENASRGRARKWSGRVVDVSVRVPTGTITQPPVAGIDAAGYALGATFEALAPYANTEARAFPPLPGAWVVAVEPIPNETGVAWPYRAALSAAAVGQIYNRANVILPARSGTPTLRIPIPGNVKSAKVVLLQGGVPRGSEKTVALDEVASK